MQRVICTCFEGYKFVPENQKKGVKPVCVGKNIIDTLFYLLYRTIKHISQMSVSNIERTEQIYFIFYKYLLPVQIIQSIFPPLTKFSYYFRYGIALDINECDDRNGDCEQKCINEVGSHRCACNPSYRLRQDNRTCEPLPVPGGSQQAAHVADRCYANCDSLVRLNEKLKSVQEKVEISFSDRNFHFFPWDENIQILGVD